MMACIMLSTSSRSMLRQRILMVRSCMMACIMLSTSSRSMLSEAAHFGGEVLHDGLHHAVHLVSVDVFAEAGDSQPDRGG